MTIRTLLRKWNGLSFILIGVVSSFILYRVSDVLFSIQTITVEAEGMRIVFDPHKVTNNLLFFPDKKIESQLLHDYPMVSSVTIKKIFPHTLFIKAAILAPIARLITPKMTVMLTHGAVVHAPTIPPPVERLPTLVFDVPAVGVGDQIHDDRVQMSIQLLEQVTPFLSITTITPVDESSLRFETAQTEIFIPRHGDPLEIATTLQSLVNGFRIRGTFPKVIDLRFQKPYIRQ